MCAQLKISCAVNPDSSENFVNSVNSVITHTQVILCARNITLFSQKKFTIAVTCFLQVAVFLCPYLIYHKVK
jgi:hypothetical protein